MRNAEISLAKITKPKLSQVFPVTRLFNLIDKAKTKPIIWVTGLPGAGKTTLVASYIDRLKLPSIWYQLDEGDADIASFFHYLGLAVRKAFPRNRKPMPHLTSEYLQGISTFTRRYFRKIYSRVPPKKSHQWGFIIVFDNYQKAPLNSGFHEVIRSGLRRYLKAVMLS